MFWWSRVTILPFPKPAASTTEQRGGPTTHRMQRIQRLTVVAIWCAGLAHVGDSEIWYCFSIPAQIAPFHLNVHVYVRRALLCRITFASSLFEGIHRGKWSICPRVGLHRIQASISSAFSINSWKKHPVIPVGQYAYSCIRGGLVEKLCGDGVAAMHTSNSTADAAFNYIDCTAIIM